MFGWRRLLGAAGLAAAVLVPAAPAAANHHFMRATEILGAVEGAPNVQYVELQMYAAGQNIVLNASLAFQDPTGTADGTVVFPNNVANGADNANILIATAEAATFFGVTPDFVMSPVMALPGGKVEFVAKPMTFGIIDAFSWGNFSGSSTGSGTPFAVGSGLPLGLSANRLIAGGTVAGQLDAGDDTGQSEADFDPGVGDPAQQRRRHDHDGRHAGDRRRRDGVRCRGRRQEPPHDQRSDGRLLPRRRHGRPDHGVGRLHEPGRERRAVPDRVGDERRRRPR